ncbi:hypothetical protein ACFVZH_38105 [Streptomyces sp. NPDC059534]|uniref:hypothetical protein n=1 Tax=Streptomyces sp. NPDC059534 TaxID=3346859 RepID=UPI0036CE42CC
MKRHTVPALIMAAGLLMTGCTEAGEKAEEKASDPTAAVLKVARDYQTAALRQDWRTACELRSTRMRYGTVEECVEDNTPDAPTATPSAESGEPDPSPTVDIVEPPRYADGSTPHPKATASRPTGGPERAKTGPVTASDVVTVPATTKHPAGYGVLITYTVQWPGKPATTTMRALRLIEEAGTWVVDQQQDISDSGAAHGGSPVRTALSGG